MNIEPKTFIIDAQNYLDKLKSDLNQVSISHHQTVEFNSSEFRNAEILNTYIKKIERTDFSLIYTIQVKQKEKLTELLLSFEKFSQLNKQQTKKKDKVNLSRYNKTDSDCIYVGSSTTDFYSRLKNHLGTRGNSVYSLHLAKWDNDNNYDIILNTYKVDKNTEQVLVELIEQQFWEKLQPVFGKKSGQ